MTGLINIGIVGFGRIGRNLLRLGYDDPRLNFVGISDVKFVYAEGLNMGEEQANKAFAEASEKIIELTND